MISHATENPRGDGQSRRAVAVSDLSERHRRQGTRLPDEIIECSRLSDRRRITFSVSSCTGYADRRQASIREMEEMA